MRGILLSYRSYFILSTWSLLSWKMVPMKAVSAFSESILFYFDFRTLSPNSHSRTSNPEVGGWTFIIHLGLQKWEHEKVISFKVQAKPICRFNRKSQTAYLKTIMSQRNNMSRGEIILLQDSFLVYLAILYLWNKA